MSVAADRGTEPALEVEVAIVGAGAVGACVAALLVAEPGVPPAAIALLEREAPDAWTENREPDLRVWALSRASERILASAGAWERIRAARASAYERMRVWPARERPRGPGGLSFDAAELGEPDLGHIVEQRLVQTALLEAFAARGGRLHRGSLRDLRFERDAVWLETEEGAIRARLVVGADGARSRVRELAGLEATIEEYGQAAIVANVRTEKPHERTAWQRFLEPGTLALLPLASGESSIVWSVPAATAARLLAASVADFEAELTAASDRVLGSIALASARLSFPLQRLSAGRYVLERCALIGDAAHVVHPLAGQGVNLGLLDAAALVEALSRAHAEREDPGALRVLRGYERSRKGANELMAAAMSALNTFLAGGSNDPLSRLAQQGLGLVDRSGALKRFFMERALGLAGELPRAAQPLRAAESRRSSPRR